MQALLISIIYLIHLPILCMECIEEKSVPPEIINKIAHFLPSDDRALDFLARIQILRTDNYDKVAQGFLDKIIVFQHQISASQFHQPEARHDFKKHSIFFPQLEDIPLLAAQHFSHCKNRMTDAFERYLKKFIPCTATPSLDYYFTKLLNQEIDWHIELKDELASISRLFIRAEHMIPKNRAVPEQYQLKKLSKQEKLLFKTLFTKYRKICWQLLKKKKVKTKKSLCARCEALITKLFFATPESPKRCTAKYWQEIRVLLSEI